MRTSTMPSALVALATLLFAGCSAGPPRFTTSLKALHRPAAKPGALERLRGWSAAQPDGELGAALKELLAQETERRCDRYLAAGAAAWRAGKRELARGLWELALECRPATSRELAIDDGTRLVVFELVERLGGSVSHFPPPLLGSGRTRWAIDADAAFVEQVYEELKLPEPALSMVRAGRILRVMAPDALTAENRALDALASAQRGWTIDLEARIVVTPESEIPASLRPLFALTTPRALTAEERGALEGALSRRELRVSSAPRVVSFPGQQANISVLTQMSYIKDYAVHVSERSAIADPEIGTIQEGLTLGLRALRLPSGGYALQLAPQLAQLARPVPTVRVKLAYGLGEVEIELPEVSVLGRVFTLRHAEGTLGWLPLGVLPDAEGTRTGHAIVVRIRAVRLEERKAGEGDSSSGR